MVGVRAVGTVVVAAVLPTALGPVIVVVIGVLLSLPLALVVTVALVAVCSADPGRRKAAKEVLDRLLSVLRPQESLRTLAPRRRGRPPPRKGQPAERPDTGKEFSDHGANDRAR
ncbi:MAG: hypothetical protein ACRDQ4_06850 [Pseudonocardiaceae bacterium]